MIARDSDTVSVMVDYVNGIYGSMVAFYYVREEKLAKDNIYIKSPTEVPLPEQVKSLCQNNSNRCLETFLLNELSSYIVKIQNQSVSSRVYKRKI